MRMMMTMMMMMMMYIDQFGSVCVNAGTCVTSSLSFGGRWIGKDPYE